MCLILSYQCWIIVELSFQGQMFFHTPPTPTAYGYMVLKIVVTTGIFFKLFFLWWQYNDVIC